MAWMSEEAAATVLGVSFKTIRRRVGNGSIRAMRQGRQIFVDIEIARIAGPNQRTASTLSSFAVANTGSTGVASINTPAPKPVGIMPPTHVPPVAPMPAKPLAATTISTASTSPPPIPTNAIPSSSRELCPERWAWLAIWVLLTLLLTASTVAAWIYQQGQSQLREADSRYQQVMLGAQQARAKHAKLIAAANKHERELTGKLSAANAKHDETNHTLAEQRNAAAKLKANLDKTAVDLAKTQSERKAMADKFISAQATAQILRWRGTLGDTIRQLAERIPQPMRSSHPAADRSRAIPLQPVDINNYDWTPTTPANTPTATLANAPATAANASNESDESTAYHRPLPHQPATLSQEDARTALRAIIKSDQEDADNATADQTGIAPWPN